MSFFTAVVVLALIGCTTAVLLSRRTPPSHEGEPDIAARAEAEAARQEIAELKERIAVLERIATDDRGRIELAEEIEKLRDE